MNQLEKRKQWIMIESAKARSTFKMCWDNMKTAVKLHKQWASLEKPCLENSWVNTHRSVRTHLENSEQLSLQSANTGPQNTAAAHWAVEERRCSRVSVGRDQRGQRSPWAEVTVRRSEDVCQSKHGVRKRQRPLVSSTTEDVASPKIRSRKV